MPLSVRVPIPDLVIDPVPERVLMRSSVRFVPTEKVLLTPPRSMFNRCPSVVLPIVTRFGLVVWLASVIFPPGVRVRFPPLPMKVWLNELLLVMDRLLESVVSIPNVIVWFAVSDDPQVLLMVPPA